MLLPFDSPVSERVLRYDTGLTPLNLSSVEELDAVGPQTCTLGWLIEQPP